MEDYRTSWLSKSDDELIRILARWWNMTEEDLKKPFKVIASFKKAKTKDENNQEFGYFENVRNLNGDLLYYPNPRLFGRVRILSEYKKGFATSDIWQINVKLASREERKRSLNPFMLIMDNYIVGNPKIQFLDRIKKEKLIRKLFKDIGSTPKDAQIISNALRAIMGDLYTETERFVFELLQNADDQPDDENFVNVMIKALDENLLFLHTGKPFAEADVESISSIGDSTKDKDSEKTGYKGIGFKSVFSDADTVYIDSGNFSFAFDKNSPVYSESENMDQVPWQIKPIWEERYRLPKEIQKEDMYFHAPVGIALNVGSAKIENYNTIIPELLSEPRFTLFLRNINKIYFSNQLGNSIVITKEKKNDGTITIESNGKTENWVSKDYIIDIPEETREAIQSDKQVPAKLKESTKTKITFAAKIFDGIILTVDNAVLFNYLPTKEQSLRFKFLVNADFLTVSNRESIHFKNVWNRFLFTQIGSLLLDWISCLSDYNGSLCLLPLKVDDSGNILATDFYNALTQSITGIAFIKGHKGNLLAIKDIMLDKSGLSNVIGKDLFCEIVNPTKSLPYYEKDEEALNESSLFENVEVYKPISVLDKIKLNVSFHKWFFAANEDLKKTFYDWILRINTEKRKPSIVSLVDNLPIYKFGDSYCYKKWVEEDSNKFVIRSPHKDLKPIFDACGYECSINIDELPINVFYSNNIIKSTPSYVFGHLLGRESFNNWLSKSSIEEKKVLIDWLTARKDTHKKEISDFLEALPIVIFEDKSCTKKAATEDPDCLIINNKLEPIKNLLVKMGFKCSQNIESSPFASMITLPKEIALFNRIKSKVGNVLLTPDEKHLLFNTLKQLEDVSDVLITQMCLFSNQTSTHRKWLSIMASYSSDYPVWMHGYIINEKENFSDIQSYLVKKERVFEDIVKKNIDEIIQITTLKEVYLKYKDSWSTDFTKYLINKLGTTDIVLDLVEEQDGDSKKYFLQKVEKIITNLNEVYTNTSYVYRVLVLAFQVLNDDELRVLSGKIWIGERTLSSFMVSDEISFDYHDGKVIRLPLIKLLPSYADTGIVQKIKNTLSGFDAVSLNRLLALKPMSTQEVWQKVDRTNGLTPYSYLLGIYRTRKVHKYYASYVPNIDLSKRTDTWVSELLSILYSQKIELHDDCFGYRLSSYFNGYISNDYVNADETILNAIEKWADTDEKISYIVGLGVKTERTNLVKCRKLLVNNETLSSSDIENIKDHISSTINLLKSKNLLPLHGNNQVAAMLALESYSKYLEISVDKEKLSANSVEYSLPEYVNWKQDSSITVFLYNGLIPYQLKKTNDSDLLICSFEQNNYWYDDSTRTLYINNSCDVRNTLYSLVSDKSVPFSAEDWQQLYYDNLVSKSEVESRDQEIEQLKRELQKYKDAFGELSKNKDVTKPEDKTKPNDNDKTQNKKEETKQETSDKQKDEDPTIKKGKEQEIPKSEQISAQLEAQKYLMEAMPEWQFPLNYGEYNQKEGKPYHFSTVEVKDRQGNPILIVLKSYKKQDKPFKLNPEELDSIFKESADLLIYTGGDIKIIKKEDLIRNQSNISLSFSTENLDIEERIDAFCSTLHFFKELHFDFSSFNIAENAESIKNIYNRNEGTQNNSEKPEEDI